MNYKYIGVLGLAVLILGSVLIIHSFGKEKHSEETRKKVLILGFDGMDPVILEKLVENGDLPNFQKLIRNGEFRKLKTSIPPQSPVAWSNFITGMNPGGHGIFDFIHRDPDTMMPYLSTSRTEAPKKTIHLGDWIIPLTGGSVKLLREGPPFWEILDKKGIPAKIIRIPANFPPVQTSVIQLAGMGTPDILGTYGTFTYYTNEDIEKYKDISGGRVVSVRIQNNIGQGRLLGPKNTFKINSPSTSVEFKVFVDQENPVGKIVVQGKEILLNEGEWSDWVRVKFDIIPFFESVNGICRFYLKSVRPLFQLYVTPINIDPASPALPISTPEDYSEELFEEIGPFYTQGIPEDTKALSGDIFDDGEFLHQTKIALDEELRMFEYELKRFKEGLFFFYIGRVDQLGHMFWRAMDPEHPAHENDTKYHEVIKDTYREMDSILGKALLRMDNHTTLIVMSDHGFAPFYRAFNLNTWLKEERYISLTDDSEGELLRNVNWDKTFAYGLGFNALYLNQKGREKYGVVNPGNEKEKLMNEITKKLMGIRDPKTGKQVISKVYKSEEIYSKEFLKNAPDLIIGYNKGFRSSWETVLGKFPKDILRDNTEKWSGDHLMEADLVPGVLLSNKKIFSDHPALYDLGPTILGEFGIPKGEGMIGRNIFKEN